MKNIIRRLILWCEKGRVYLGVSVLLALIVWLCSWSFMWGAIVFVFFMDLKVLYETLASFGYQDYDRENWNVVSAILALLLTFMGIYFFHRYLGDVEFFESLGFLLKVEFFLFAISVLLYLLVQCWISAVKWAKK